MNVPPLHIGPLTINFPFLLAPMAGYTDFAFRSLCIEYGAGAVYTEVTSAEGLVRGSRSTIQMLETLPSEHPIAGHIYGSHPESMARAAAHIETLGRFDFIDINCGCPVRKIVAKGAGAALMKSPEKVEQIVRAVVAAVSLPVTIKTRIGYTPDAANISEVAHAAEAGGARAIAIHGRFASSVHKGPSDWATIARIKQERSIPVIGNGGVDRAADALEMIRQTGVDGVMIGRAAVGNPWIFKQIRSLLNGDPLATHSLEEHRRVMMEHLDLITRLITGQNRKRRSGFVPEETAVLQFRAHLVRYLCGFRGFGDVKRSLQTMNTRELLTAAIDKLLIDAPHVPTRD